MDGKSSPKRWRPGRLSVRVLMALILVLGGGLGWVAHRARVQRQAVEAIRQSGGSVIYDWQRMTGKPIDFKAEPNWPRWMVERLGADYFGSVVIVQLGMKATNADMAHVGRLPKLVSVTVPQTNQITDSGAAHLARLVDLESVNLTGTKVTGAFLANLRGLTKLKFLPLIGLPISDADLAHVEGLTGLERLDLTSTRVTDEGLAHLKGLVNLQQLDLTSTEVAGPGLAHLEGMTQLKQLTLAKSQLRDLSSLPRLPKLILLVLDETAIDDVHLPDPSKLPVIAHLGLRQTAITDAALDTLQGLKGSLTSLELSGTKVTDNGVPALLKLGKLNRLFLDGTKVTDATLERLADLKGLKTINLKGAPVTDAGLVRLRTALPELRSNQDIEALVRAQRLARAKAAASRQPAKAATKP